MRFLILTALLFLSIQSSFGFQFDEWIRGIVEDTLEVWDEKKQEFSEFLHEKWSEDIVLCMEEDSIEDESLVENNEKSNYPEQIRSLQAIKELVETDYLDENQEGVEEDFNKADSLNEIAITVLNHNSEGNDLFLGHQDTTLVFM